MTLFPGLTIGFALPWMLAALLALPLLWILLRAVPPAPVVRRFPGVALMLGLVDDQKQADRTPWWLLLLRAVALAAAIIGLAGPVLNPDKEGTPSTARPLLILFDGGWSQAPDWAASRDRATRALAEATRQARPVALVRLTDAPPPVPIHFAPGSEVEGALLALEPAAILPGDLAPWVALLPEGGFDSLWLSDGLVHPGRTDLAETLADRGGLRVVQSAKALVALNRPRLDKADLVVSALRPDTAGPATTVEVRAIGPDPAGIERELARLPLTFASGKTGAEGRLDLPPELRNRLQRFEILGQNHAGAVSLADDSLRRRKVALLAGAAKGEGLQLLDPLHFLRQALAPSTDLIEGSLRDVLPAKPDVIVLADVAQLTRTEAEGLTLWAENGGLLLRFAGPRLAASDLSRDVEDPLMPVRLRQGGRDLGGAMSWGEAKTLAAFPAGSPFFGLPVPGELAVRQQVLAQPDPDLSERSLASLTDGTPLVTRKPIGAGQVVLFHVTANAEWSNLPLSGLFVQMLERLAVTAGAAGEVDQGLTGTSWQPERLLDGRGALVDASARAGVTGAVLAQARTSGPGFDVGPGLYRSDDRRIALNATDGLTALTPAVWPAGVTVEGLAAPQPRNLSGPLLGLALGLLALDILASLVVGGRLGRPARGATAALALVLCATNPTPPQAQEADQAAILATRGIALAYVITGDAGVDQTSAAGLLGLSDQLWARTSVEPEPPIGVDLETDELAFFPFLYWPLTQTQPLPSAEAYAKLNQFLRSGGMILFDTRDADVAGLGGALTPEGAHLQVLAAGLDIPALEPLPQDHVLTRSFYILGDLPGRQFGAPIWVEAAPVEATTPDSADAPQRGFRNANDGVTPVIIGGNDWAAAWAVQDDGRQMFPVGRGNAGEDQREMAFRAGINIVMHVLTGNYKSDQVHVPALLERLGQ
jgi:hypothetical protein